VCRLRGQDNLSNVERVLGILRDIDRGYTLSNVDRVQLMWCIDVVASQRLYTGFFVGPKGEPIRFQGVDDETAQWLVGNYSLSKARVCATAARSNAMRARGCRRRRNARRRRWCTPRPLRARADRCFAWRAAWAPRGARTRT